MANDKFERIEKKFWMSASQFEEMKTVLSGYMEIDKYGRSLIRNIYCDSDDYALIRKSIERPKFKEKLRIRSYGGFDPDSDVFVEIKRKLDGIGYKRRIEVPFKQAEKLLAGDEIEADNPQIERELHEFIKRYHPKPKVYLTYERTAMTGREDPSLRITIDRDIRYRLITEDFDYNDKETYPVMDDESMVLMEVKACAGMPGWLIHEMSRLKIYHTSFSKIGTCFTKHIAPRLHFETQTMKDTVPVYSRYYSHMAVPRIAGM